MMKMNNINTASITQNNNTKYVRLGGSSLFAKTFWTYLAWNVLEARNRVIHRNRMRSAFSEYIKVCVVDHWNIEGVALL